MTDRKKKNIPGQEDIFGQNETPETATEEQPDSASFEMLLKRLEEIVNTMESGGLSLDESLKLYEEGVKKADKLTAMLAEARNRVMKLVGDKNGGAVLESFEEEDIS